MKAAHFLALLLLVHLAVAAEVDPARRAPKEVRPARGEHRGFG